MRLIVHKDHSQFRVAKEKCVGCGSELIWPFNEYNACSACTKKIMKSKWETKMHSHKKVRGRPIVIPKGKLFVPKSELGDKVT